MVQRRNRVCGADVHKDLIVATIQSSDGSELQEKLGTTSTKLEKLRDWLLPNNCEQVALKPLAFTGFPSTTL